jgi:putative endonuclease
MRQYYVYILRCFDGTFYTGVTNDVDKRFAQHCAGESRDSYTRFRHPLQLVHVSEFTRIGEAIDFEKQLKGWSHRKKRAFIEGDWQSLKRFARGKDKVPNRPRS